MHAMLTAGPIESAFHLARAALVACVRLADRALLAVAQGIWDAQMRARERAHLAELDDRCLRDMGITRYDVAMEADKPFWRR